MRNSKFKIGFILAILLLFPSALLSKSLYRFAYSPKLDIYFGHISVVDVQNDGADAVVMRRSGIEPELAVLNLPVWAGDTIRTTESRRCEIQFDTGTIIRLDYSTELKIETIMAQSLSSKNKITNLVLNQGEIYIMYKRYNIPEFFQVLTRNAAVKLNHNTIAALSFSEEGKTAIHVNKGKVTVVR